MILNLLLPMKRFDWGIQERAKGMSIMDVFKQEAYKIGRIPSEIVVAGGKGFVDPYKELFKGKTVKQSITPDWMKEAPSWYKWAPPSGTEVIDTIKDVVKVPTITLPEIKIPSGIIQVGKLPDISMGADILGGIEMPSMPSFSLKDEEGDLNPLMLAALAIGGFYIVKKVT